MCFLIGMNNLIKIKLKKFYLDCVKIRTVRELGKTDAIVTGYEMRFPCFLSFRA